MTMNLTWTDRSNNEEGYKVYRDKQVIATLAPNSTTFVDVAFVATGKTLSYSVEAFNNDWRSSTSTITYGLPVTNWLPQVTEANTPRSMDVAGNICNIINSVVCSFAPSGGLIDLVWKASNTT